MKTQITTSPKTFQPITISITIETKEELGCFLDLTNCPVKLVELMDDYSLDFASTKDMTLFLDGLANTTIFNELNKIYLSN